ncbi:MAG: EVE domain-containing protein [Chloroflexi bacterium]|nr:EVE domain-containing protein [Chloroflexota bacterium]
MSTNGSSAARRAWIFQANPARYRIFETLATQPVERWNLRQHCKGVRVGDRVYIWVAGEAAGIYAVGTVLTSPEIAPDSPIGIRHWTDPAEGKRLIARVDVCYDRIMLDHPLLKEYLQADPILRDLTILHAPRGTNFALSGGQANAIEEWLSDHS